MTLVLSFAGYQSPIYIYISDPYSEMGDKQVVLVDVECSGILFTKVCRTPIVVANSYFVRGALHGHLVYIYIKNGHLLKNSKYQHSRLVREKKTNMCVLFWSFLCFRLLCDNIVGMCVYWHQIFKRQFSQSLYGLEFQQKNNDSLLVDRI